MIFPSFIYLQNIIGIFEHRVDNPETPLDIYYREQYVFTPVKMAILRPDVHRIAIVISHIVFIIRNEKSVQRVRIPAVTKFGWRWVRKLQVIH